MPDENVISIGITADAGTLNAAMTRMTADVKNSLAVLEAAFARSNSLLKFVPKAELGAFKEQQEELKNQIFRIHVNLEQLAKDWDTAAIAVKAAQDKMAAARGPQLRGAGGQFLPLPPGPAEIQAEVDAALAAQRAVAERMQKVQSFATVSAGAPGSRAPHEEAQQQEALQKTALLQKQNAEQAALDAEEEVTAKEQVIAAEQALQTKLEETAALRKEWTSEAATQQALFADEQIASEEKSAAARAGAQQKVRAEVAATSQATSAQIGLFTNMTAKEEAAQKSLRAQIAETGVTQKAASAEVTRAAKASADAQRQLGAAAAQGNKEAAAGIAQFRAELTAAQESEEILTEQSQRLNAELKALAASFIEAEGAADKAGGATRRVGTEAQQTMYKLRATEDALTFNFRRMTTQMLRLAMTSETLGAVMQAAFTPVLIIGAITLIGEMAEKVYKVYENFVHLKDAMEALVAFEDKLQKHTDAAIEKTEQLEVEKLKNQGKLVEAAEKQEQQRDAKPLELKTILDPKSRKELNELSVDFQKFYGKAFENVEGGANKLANLTTRYNEVAKAASDAKLAQDAFLAKHPEITIAPNEEGIPTAQTKRRPVAAPVGGMADSSIVAAGQEAGALDTRKANQLQAEATYLEKFRGMLGREREQEIAQREEGAAAVDKAGQEEAAKREAAARKAQEAILKREQEIHQADQHELAVQERDHDLTTAELITFWEGKLAKESQYARLDFELQNTLAHLRKEQRKQEASERTADAQASSESLLRPDESADYAAREKFWAQKLALDQDGIAKKSRQQSEADTDEKEVAKNHAAALRQIDEDRVKANKLAFDELQTTRQLSATEEATWWLEIAFQARVGSKENVAAIEAVIAAQRRIPAELHRQQVGEVETQYTGDKGGLEQQRAQGRQQEQLSGGGFADKQAELRNEMSIDQQEIQLAMQKFAKLRELARGNANEIKELDKQETAALIEDQKRLAEHQFQMNMLIQQTWKKMFTDINQGFTSTIDGMMKHQESFSQGMVKMWNNMVQSMLNLLLKIALQWAEQELLITVLHLTGVQTRAAADLAYSMQERLWNAEDAAGSAYAATAGIPIIGPVLAPIAAAGAFAAVMAFEQGGIVPNGGPSNAVLHPNEMVLPAPLSQGFQRMLGAGGGGGGTTHLHYAPTVHAYGAGGMEDMLKSHASTIHTIVKRGQRTGHL
jgi:hypothetical protein